MAKDTKTLTTRFDAQTWAEFSAAVEVLGFRSINSLVHQLVMTKIREAKDAVDAAEFQQIVEDQKKQIQKRSKLKTRERQEMIGALPKKDTAEIVGKPSAARRLERPVLTESEPETAKKKKKVA